MMTRKTRSLPFWLLVAAASCLAVMPARAQAPAQTQAQPQAKPQAQLPDQKAPGSTAPDLPETTAPAPAKGPVASPIQLAPAKEPAAAAPKPVNRLQAYYHLGLAAIYEENAAEGHSEDVSRAVEEYKLALNADPTSPTLNNALADLYLHSDHVREAENTARELLKTSPDDIDAHRLLGRIYLRELSEEQNAPASTSPSGTVLDKAIAEFEKIIALQPSSVADRMVLGQLYTVKHESKKAEEQFKTAQSMEPDSEEVVLNLARLYSENSDVVNEIKTLEAVPENGRSAKMEDALGAAYEQLKQPKQAIAAYRRALGIEPDDLPTRDALAQALLTDNQLDEALKEFNDLLKADPENVGVLVHVGEILRRQGKYEDALAAIRKARAKAPDDLDAGYNEGLLLDALGRLDEAAAVCEKMVDLTSHANGAYNPEEKNNRSIFLERLGAVYQEQNKIDLAVATFQKLIDMGGDSALRGFEAQSEAYGEAKMFDRAVEVARKAVDLNPKDPDLKLMLAGALLEQGKGDEAIALAKGLLNGTGKDRVVWLRLGQFDTELRRWNDAAEDYEKAGALTTKNEDIAYLDFLKGALEEREKHYKPAQQFFQKALKLQPDSAMTLNYLGYMMADRGERLPEALTLIRKAVDQEPMNGAYLDSLGWVYFKMGDYEMAEQNLRQAVARDATDATVHDHMGDLYAHTGRIRLAAAQWELSLAAYAKSAPDEAAPEDVAKVRKKLDAARAKLAKENTAQGQAKQE
jgi:tetratricopeptide (TPR) repeat protein